MSQRHVLVVYDTRYGNTWKVAEALAKGLGSADGVSAVARPVQEVHSDDLEAAELLVIGGPTEFFHASHHMREFFDRIGGFELRGKYGFAFDTHARSGLTGSAAASIERELKSFGVEILRPHASALTVDLPGRATAPSAERIALQPGTEQEFEQVGRQLGASLLAHPLLVRSAEPSD